MPKHVSKEADPVTGNCAVNLSENTAARQSRDVSGWVRDRGANVARKVGVLFAMVAFSVTPLSAQQTERFDPDDVYTQGPVETVDGGGIDGDLAGPRPPNSSGGPYVAPSGPDAVDRADGDNRGTYAYPADPEGGYNNAWPNGDVSQGDLAQPDQAQPEAAIPDTVRPETGTSGIPETDIPQAQSGTYGEDDLIGAAEGVFGKGAEGLARLIEDLLKDQGEPNGYIVGREAGGAFVFGARYGSGTLHHKVEGQQQVYWTGPSVGFDAGANAANTFVLVYNLYDSEDLFRRYPAGEGQAYFVGGLHASYMRRGDVVLIPIRMGAGVRLGVNAGYMRFSKKQRWVPF